MATKHEQGEMTLTRHIHRAATTLQHLGHSVIKKLDVIPPSGTHAYRDGIGQLRVDEIPRPNPPKHSQETGNAFLSVQGIRQAPETPPSPHELNHQPLLTHSEHMTTPHRPSWMEK